VEKNQFEKRAARYRVTFAGVGETAASRIPMALVETVASRLLVVSAVWTEMVALRLSLASVESRL